MELVSFSFIFVFLPLSILLYYLLPLGWRNHCLLALSLLFYGFLNWRAMLVMVFLVGLQYAAARAIHRLGREKPAARRICRVTAGATVGLLVLAAAAAQIRRITLPLGLFIYLLTGLGYVVDYYRDEAGFEESPVRFGVMCCFFGKLYAGPLVEYQEFGPLLRCPANSLTEVGEGVLQFVRGLAKKVLLADQIYVVFTAMAGIPGGQLPVLGAWLLTFSAAFYTYFTLSGYCDMAMGLARVFGLSLPQNFSYPLQSRTVTDFFARFNITVTRYIRRYVYRLLGSDSGGRLSNSFNLMLTAILAGLWFGLRLNTLVWGMALGLFMIVEVLWGHRLFEHIPPFFLRLYAFGVVLLSFALLAGSSLGQSFNTLLVMTGLSGHSFTSSTVEYMLASRAVVLVACVLFSTSLYARVGQWLRKRYPLTAKTAAVASNILLLMLTLSVML